ncbi:MAG: PaaI family thioesterase [Chloroflexi bacterium]|nr:PaaI family thioesterase [Chloroflexota bacterium]
MSQHTPNRHAYEPASFAEMLGTEKVASSDGWAMVRMPIRPRHRQGAGSVQGGLIVALADLAFSSALGTLLMPGQRSVTVELKVNFIAPASQGELVAEGRITHKGNTLAVGEMTVTDGSGTLIAKGLGTWMILRPRQG